LKSHLHASRPFTYHSSGSTCGRRSTNTLKAPSLPVLVFPQPNHQRTHRPTTLVLPVSPSSFVRFAGTRFLSVVFLSCPLLHAAGRDRPFRLSVSPGKKRSHRDSPERHSASSLCRSWEACESAGQSLPINHHARRVPPSRRRFVISTPSLWTRSSGKKPPPTSSAAHCLAHHHQRRLLLCRAVHGCNSPC
jgi:hypothetical protein